MTGEMVDRVASEIAAHIALNPWAKWEDVAKAAIEAMRNPTPEMIRAAVNAPLTQSAESKSANVRKYFTERWDAMISAALLS